jgi:Holliday junction resolvasome RuvABC endonuclease subunit
VKVLGIDFSLNGTGLSIFEDGDIIFKRVFVKSLNKNRRSDSTYIKSPEFKTPEQKLDWVCHTILSYCTDLDLICMEGHIGKYYSWMDGYGILKYLFRCRCLPCIMISPSQLKKFATGHGNADKEQMSVALKQQYNLDLDYIGSSANNIVDATWLSILGGLYFKFISNTSTQVYPQQKEILEKLTI